MWIHWVAVGVLVLIGLYFLKFDHHARKIKLILLAVIGILLYFSIIGIFRSESVDVSSPSGIANAVYVYFGWVGNAIANLWDVGGETVKMVGDAVRINGTG